MWCILIWAVHCRELIDNRSLVSNFVLSEAQDFALIGLRLWQYNRLVLQPRAKPGNYLELIFIAIIFIASSHWLGGLRILRSAMIANERVRTKICHAFLCSLSVVFISQNIYSILILLTRWQTITCIFLRRIESILVRSCLNSTLGLVLMEHLLWEDPCIVSAYHLVIAVL